MGDGRRRRVGALALCAAAAGLVSACVSNRLSGPIHGAEGPAWISERAPRTSPPIEIAHRLILIGDAGLYLEDDPTLLALGRAAAEAPSSTVLFLGDNIYDDGLVDDDRERGEKILAQQLAAADANKIVVPGNHDWGMDPAKQNTAAILNQQRFVDGWRDGSAEFLPKDGCMGPATRRLAAPRGGHRGISIVALDPTPWINPRLRDACPEPETPESHLERLDAALRAHSDDWIVVASHYPMLTGGPHGGLTYGFLADLIVGVFRWWYGGLGNTYEPAYADWIARTGQVMRAHRPLVYASGHDHSLQVLEGDDRVAVHVVSGAGAPDRVSTVTNIDETLFAHAHPGFVILDFGRRSGRDAAVLRVVENGRADPVFEMDLR